MDDLTMWQAAIEAQFLMGHCVPSPHLAVDKTTIVEWGWDVDQVRQHLHVPLNELWEQRLLELLAHGQATFTMYGMPYHEDAEGRAVDVPNWQDTLPFDDLSDLDIFASGVLRLADRYGKPYVRLGESRALLEHWKRVQREAEERAHMPYDEAKWAAEWPEAYARWQARLAEWERKHGG